jgi:uncharacterized OB-fold protein
VTEPDSTAQAESRARTAGRRWNRAEPEPPFGDPLTSPFWQAAADRRLLIQRCEDCGHHQFFPRPFCIACQSDAVAWVAAAGTGTVYTRTTVHLEIASDLKPPYVVAVVELDEGPRLTTNLTDPDLEIGERVAVAWREREDAPPFPVFGRLG